MLKLSLFEFLVRTVPESFTFIYCLLIFAKTKFRKVDFVKSSIILCTAVFLVRMLPINYGVHVVLNIIILVSITNIICKVEVITAMKTCIIITVLSFLYEGINVAVLSMIFQENFGNIISNPYTKTVLGLPSLVALIITGVKYKKYISFKEYKSGESIYD